MFFFPSAANLHLYTATDTRYNYAYPASVPEERGDFLVRPFAMVADMDKRSKDASSEEAAWHSKLVKGELLFDRKTKKYRCVEARERSVNTRETLRHGRPHRVKFTAAAPHHGLVASRWSPLDQRFCCPTWRQRTGAQSCQNCSSTTARCGVTEAGCDALMSPQHSFHLPSPGRSC